eukprot:TRINITY_DN236_c0_g2_i1.p2 TRINITY_DN236_c0_g2~~TRINITY_DN236_c0_g2_i1.p2  ORF type:complete len:251 (+),score=-4.10 TRINITY_DN236_c0_g2_i1:3003-3755(+)
MTKYKELFALRYKDDVIKLTASINRLIRRYNSYKKESLRKSRMFLNYIILFLNFHYEFTHFYDLTVDYPCPPGLFYFVSKFNGSNPYIDWKKIRAMIHEKHVHLNIPTSHLELDCNLEYTVDVIDDYMRFFADRLFTFFNHAPLLYLFFLKYAQVLTEERKAQLRALVKNRLAFNRFWKRMHINLSRGFLSLAHKRSVRSFDLIDSENFRFLRKIKVASPVVMSADVYGSKRVYFKGKFYHLTNPLIKVN